MKIIISLYILFYFIVFNCTGQIAISPKGTKINIDTSKWKMSGNNIYNKNSGFLGIGTSNPSAQLHTTGDLRFEGIGSNTTNSKILTADGSGNITTRLLSNMLSGNTVTTINGLSNSSQTFVSGISGIDFNISSSGSVHSFNLPTASASNRGALSSNDWILFNGKENSLTFSNGLTRNVNSITVNTTQNINTLSNLTSNGLIKTSGGTGALSIATLGSDYSAGTASLATGILKSTTGTGVLSIASASDFPILNQNTTGNAATVTTNANLTGIVTSVGNTTSITTNGITNNMLSQIPTKTFKGRTTAGTGNVEDLTPTEATAMLNTFTDVTQGLVPSSGGGTNNFLRADGIFAVPSGNNYRTLVTTTSDVINANSVPNTLTNVTGLFFNVVAGTTYRFFAMIPYTSSASSNGSRWTINAPASSFLSYNSRYTINATSETVNYLSTINSPASCNNNSEVNGSLAIIQGIIRPSTNGTVQIRFASENGNQSITAKAGATLEYW